MTVTCASCQRTIQVPPDKAAVPNLKVKCRCGNVFAVAPAMAAPAPTAPVAVAVAPVAPPRPPPAAAPRPIATAAAARPAAAAPVVKPVNGEARAATPAPHPAVTPVPPGAPPRPDAPSSGVSVATNWRRCANHRQERADSVCPKCIRGYCPSCVQVVQGGAICAQCDGLCVSVTQYEDVVQQARQRDRPLMDDLGLILSYPLRDRMGFVLLALFTWFFGIFSGMFPIAYLLSKGVLLWYTFYALSRVASGNLKDFMPDMRDMSDLVQPARLAFAAFLISTGPILLITLFIAGATLPLGIGTSTGPSPRAAVVHAQTPEAAAPVEEAEPDETDAGKDEEPDGQAGSPAPGGRRAGRFEGFPEEKPSVLGPILLLVAVAWKILYTPVALVVAALSRSFLSTINPAIGIWAIQKMGSVYWQCLGIYCVLAGTQWILGVLLGFIPIAGGFVAAFINAYAYLAIACTLGLGVFKKAPELGWD